MEMKERKYIEDEIDLRDYIKVIIRRKKIILTVFFTAVIAVAVASLLMPRVYRATTSIMIMPSRLPTALSPTQISLAIEREELTGEYITPRPAISVPTHQVLLESNTVLERIIDRLKLTNQLGRPITLDSLRRGLSVEEIEDTNVLQLKVGESQPKRAREIADSWAEEYLKFHYELISGETRGMGDFVVSQFEIAQESLLQAEEAVKDFKDKHKIDLMQAELSIKREKLNNEKGNTSIWALL
jgi:uncharacterized protein involved in exopolysaccharide biosynthesis